MSTQNQDWEEQVKRLVGTLWRQAGGGLSADIKEDCVFQARLALHLHRVKIGDCPPAEQPAYAEVIMRRAVWRLLKKEQEVRAQCIPMTDAEIEGVLEEAGAVDVEARVIAGLDLAEQIGDNALAAAMKSLKAGQRKILHLYYVEGLTDSEIGAVLEITLKTAQTRRCGALKRLRRLAPVTPRKDS